MTYGIIDMNNYEEIMNGLVKLREYCKKNKLQTVAVTNVNSVLFVT